MMKIENLNFLNPLTVRDTIELKGGNNRNKNREKLTVEELSNGNACPPPR